MSYQTAFPDFPSDGIKQLPEGFVDHSYRNDCCPVFVDTVLGVAVWFDYPDETMRECEGTLYSVQSWDEGEGYATDPTKALYTDDWSEVMEFLHAQMRAYVKGARRTA